MVPAADAPAPSTPAPFDPGAFHLGCAVWGHPGWVGPVFPEGTSPRRNLEEYVQRFAVVEGNSTFYGLPAPDTLSRWRATMPDGFQILPKLPREVTHEGALMERVGLRDVALQLFTRLGDRCGPILLQLPPRYGPQRLDDLLAFLDDWPEGAPVPLVEFRHLGWFDEAVAPRLHEALVERAGRGGPGGAVGRVILDTRPIYAFGDDPQAGNPRKKPALPVPVRPPAPRVMVRFVGHPQRDLNERWLPRWAELVDGWLREEREVYVFCHCPIEDHSPFIARRLQTLLEERGAPVPPLPWDDVEEPGQQGQLF